MKSFSNIVIAGGGIVGNSIAYYLAKRSVPVTLIDPVGIAPAASAKAGGFLARDWRDGTPLEELHRTSFDLHEDLAKEFGTEKIDYRRLTCAAVAVDGGAVQKPSGRKMKDVEWVDVGVMGTNPMGDERTIAQVHPRKLCEAMWEYSQSQGSKLHIGRVTEAIVDNDGIMKGVKLEDGTTIAADAFIVACGPWTDEARSWFPNGASVLPHMTGVKCHSILLPSKRVLNQAVFFEASDGQMEEGGVEVYPRPDGDAYVNGFEDGEMIVQERPGEEAVIEDDINLLKEAIRRTSTELGGLEPHTKQACYWPETPDGLPFIGTIPGINGAYVAAGHSVWGILQGPATGLSMSELLLDGKSTTVDLTSFDLRRFV
mmetsp:Transcript_10550/g.16219  ORF Transcript_10550/g.16219 Transcript_10550/m.16219 type:complete len:371 (+) Transcript_10550:88-1200(+)